MISHAIRRDKHLFHFSKTINCTNYNLQQITRKVIQRFPCICERDVLQSFFFFKVQAVHMKTCTEGIARRVIFENNVNLLKK